ncbi:MAG: hypothetical protein V7K50_16915 [Nostoc sp.]|uniref:hypothetical protein n=1 Tax=Nostoc sp. TaxID=1180 RepID=UPI002FF583D3
MLDNVQKKFKIPLATYVLISALLPFPVTLLFAVISEMQKPAVALVSNRVSEKNLLLKTKQSILIVLDDTYWGAQHDFEIMMPGKVESNDSSQLTSWSATSQTTYIIIQKDLPRDIFYLSTQEIRQLLQSSMREKIVKKGKVVKSTNLVIDEAPGIELVVQNDDGTLGQYQAFLVKGRMYVLGAVADNELTTETVNFFDSFRVYPQRIRYSE